MNKEEEEILRNEIESEMHPDYLLGDEAYKYFLI